MPKRVSDSDREKLATAQIHAAEIEASMADLKGRHNDTMGVLDELRRTRKSRGGVGAPLIVPGSLSTAAEGKPSIIITDAELDKDSHRGRTQE